jgi:large subunit ribosomal protein L15
MQIHELKPAKGSIKKKHRVGRGHGSGWVMTAGKGTKGQKARSGGAKGPGFEGGQTPWYRRLPKIKGFKNALFKVEYQEVPLYRLNVYEDGTVVDPVVLYESGIIRKTTKLVKVLGNGELQKRLVVKAHAFSQSAEEKIKAKGGSVEVLS